MKEAAELWVELQVWLADNYPYIRVEDIIGKLPNDGKWPTVSMNDRIGFCFHHAGAWGTAKGAAVYHIRERGWPGIAYCIVIEQDGSITLSQPLNAKTYSQGFDDPEGVDENKLWIGVLVNGNFESQWNGYKDGAGEPSAAQIASVLALVAWGARKGLSATTGHFEHGKPACPGTTLEQIIRAIQYNEPEEEPEAVNLDTVLGRQQALSTLDYYEGKLDGLWGWRSKTALRNFQKDAKIVVDGEWGKQSKAAMVVALNKL